MIKTNSTTHSDVAVVLKTNSWHSILVVALCPAIQSYLNSIGYTSSYVMIKTSVIEVAVCVPTKGYNCILTTFK